MTVVNNTTLDKQSSNAVNKTRRGLPFSRLWAITAILSIAITSVSCTDEPEEESTNETPAVSQETAPEPVKEVCLYQHKDYEGWEKCYRSDEPNFVKLGINDAVSSLKVKGGAKARLFEHTDYNGFKKKYTKDTPWVGDKYNDKFSSLKIK